ncbi:c-cup [Drosophila busckii]|uniref:C-cup n=1 Tax=Drosophila busckii TaxID=30019 RepID=A0A0M3QU08_DROBS|nr:uncharacterized protein LOC108604612 [Drosophila busckii]ALC39809.1 c-cup [Drosophila busckii]
MELFNKMSLRNVCQLQMQFPKLNSNMLLLLRPVFKNPIGQVLLSFLLGYYATTKIAGLIAFCCKQPAAKDATASKDNAAAAAENVATQQQQQQQLLLLTERQLSKFNGLVANQPIYTALNGNIYDLSPSRDMFLKPGLYSLLAGCNANQMLNIAYGSMDVSLSDVLQRWEARLNAEFNIIGILIDSDASDNSDKSESECDSSLVSKDSEISNDFIDDTKTDFDE